jgi:3D (Asp-Asp-Asp) domain-containing protein
VNRRFALGAVSVACQLLLLACGTAGSTWISEPLVREAHDDFTLEADEITAQGFGGAGPRPRRPRTIVLGQGELPPEPITGGEGSGYASGSVDVGGASAVEIGDGRSLGTFRNTYYDFPNERAFDGPRVAVKGPRCETLSEVPRAFYETLCVQGSGRLATGQTVSFSKRNCGCAEVCPRTGERICFDALDAAKFPFGRGATGRAITPLLTVAVDSDVVPLGTTVYVPELAGLPRDESNGARHDGCLLAEDRGVRVKGKQVDIFTGDPRMTALWNRLLPSNRCVTVVVGSSRCGARR